MKIIEYPEKKDWKEILQRPVMDAGSLEGVVNEILTKVKTGGDSALKEFSLKFDKAEITDFLVSEKELREAGQRVSEDLKAAMKVAKNNIEKFHGKQHEIFDPVETTQGVKCWRKSIGIEKVGLYIPGGSAPLFSTILMLAVPANLAGCKEIVLCTPPSADGSVHPAILYAASLTGISKFYKVGGAQAIGAMAFGTESIPKVFKIFGPGNQYVTMAKQLVSKSGVAIDMPAGPSEVAVVADKFAHAEFVAADILSQAEHGVDSHALVVSDDKNLLENVLTEVEKQLQILPRKDLAKISLQKSKAVLLRDLDEAMDLINEYAPEHLIIQVKGYERLIDKVINAGSVFLGNYTPEAAGDYASGTNHTLPTNGYATAYSGVSLDSFVRKVTFQEINASGLKELGPVIEIMAEAEQLIAHKNAVTVRLKSL
ncbi:MAG: histidinol dehydrogenase [Cytophagaceae bacterium]